MSDKELDKIKKYLKGKSVLLVTESATDRTAWKKLFVELGVGLNDFHNANTLYDANEVLKTKSVDILFTSMRIGKDTAFEILEKHLEKYPNRTDHFCFFVSERNSLAIAALIAELDVDGLILKPYNQQDLLNSVKEVMLNRIGMKEEDKTYLDMLGKVRAGELGEAESIADDYIKKWPVSPNAFYIKGAIRVKQNKLEQAVQLWKGALDLNPKHYLSLCNLFDTYAELKQFKEAYEVAEILTEEFPINPTRIPNLIRASLATGNYHNLISFCEMIIGLEEDLEAMKRPIAAALALSGKSIIQQEKFKQKDLVIQVTKRALELVDKQSMIYLTSLENLLQLECYKDLQNYLDQISSEDMTADLYSLELELYEKTKKAADVFVRGQEMLKEGTSSARIYTVLLRVGKEIGKSKEQLEDLFYDASKLFPEEKSVFEKILND